MAAALTLGACATVSRNHSQADCRQLADAYRITLHGTRPNATHSLLYYLVRPNLDRTFELVVPRLSGTISGAEVSHPPQPQRRFAGGIEIADRQMTVALQYPGGTPPVDLDWNGRYELGACVR